MNRWTYFRFFWGLCYSSNFCLCLLRSFWGLYYYSSFCSYLLRSFWGLCYSSSFCLYFFRSFWGLCYSSRFFLYLLKWFMRFDHRYTTVALIHYCCFIAIPYLVYYPVQYLDHLPKCIHVYQNNLCPEINFILFFKSLVWCFRILLYIFFYKYIIQLLCFRLKIHVYIMMNKNL